ncbi:MAG: S8 family serine peptidase [Candidatus Melainabacteria bacterium]|nr:S8 family serine peptidase [Candidatus Melainabacteria bacterium]
MEHLRKYLIGILCAIFLCSIALINALAKENSDYNSLIVIAKEGLADLKRPEGLLKHRGITGIHKVNKNTYVVLRNESKSLEEQISELKASNLFKTVEPNYTLTIDSERIYTEVSHYDSEDDDLSNQKDDNSIKPNDQGYASQYYLKQINANKAWDLTTGDSNLVAVLDTGVDADHPDLVGKVIGRVGKESEDLTDNISHGTGIAGLIAAHTNNHEGIAGISWNTMILSIKITDDFGQARVSDVVSALEDVYTHDAKIAQISLSTNQYSQALEEAIKLAESRGIFIISTGGNSGINEVRYPAGFDGALGVGAVNEFNELESYSSKGNHITLVAPGASIYTTSSLFDYEAQSGTSFAAPQVAGAVALIRSVAPSLTCQEIRDILIDSAKDLGALGQDEQFGYGLLNTKKAVELAQESTIEEEQTELVKSWVIRN